MTEYVNISPGMLIIFSEYYIDNNLLFYPINHFVSF